MIDNIYHVYPVKDSELHHLEFEQQNLRCLCKCKPYYIKETNCYIVIHNSFDGREGVEWVNEILMNHE